MRYLIPKYLHLIFELTVFFLLNAARRRIKTIRIAGGNITLFNPCTRQFGYLFKDFILNICSLRNYEFFRHVRFRVNSTILDLHVADARYHQDCKTLFLQSKYDKRFASNAPETLEVDIGLESDKKALEESQKEMWKSVVCTQRAVVLSTSEEL